MTLPSKGVVSLFTGAGGLDAGLEQAGFATLLAIDHDPDSIKTLQATKKAKAPIASVPTVRRTYLAEARIVEADITTLTKAQLLALWGRPGERPAVLAGGPPCQSFSSAGRMRGLQDVRGRLFEDFVRATRALQPEFVLFENVQGLVTARDAAGQIGGVLKLVQSSFERAGYAFAWALVNAADYGCAQRRVRLVGVGSRRYGLPTMPPNSTYSRDGGERLSLLRWRTIREALADMPQPEATDLVWARPELHEKLSAVAPGSGIRVGGTVEANRPGGHWGYRQDGFIADLDQPSRTIRSASTPDWLRLEDGSHRRLTWRECARLQGFPDGWAFQGKTTSKFRQVGNAVPVELGRALGDTIAAALMEGPLARGHKPVSPPWPASFGRRIRYTTAEQRVNGHLRRAPGNTEVA